MAEDGSIRSTGSSGGGNGAPTGPAFEVVDPEGDEARWAVGRYFEELDRRFAGGFDPVPGGADDDALALRPPGGAFVVARVAGAVVGCVGVHDLTPDTAEVKRMWIDPGARGMGLGRALLEWCERWARSSGRTRIVLDTNGTLTEAIALYRRAGYEAIEAYNDNPYAQHWFAKALPSEPS